MSHDRGVATKAETHRAARWQGTGRGGRGAEPPAWSRPVTTALRGSSASAAHEQLNAPVANAAANPPPGQRRGGP